MMNKGTRIGEDQKAVEVSHDDHYFVRLMDLPTAVLHDILFRLPMSSIMKVKLVCRAMHELISRHPDFALNYAKNYSFASIFNTNKYSSTLDLDLIEFSDNYQDCFRTTFKIPETLPEGYYNVRSCNGLLCLSTCKEEIESVYICNPIEGECMDLPGSTLRLWKHISNYAQYAFGFCTSTNNYKVLKIIKFPQSHGEIFTIGSDDTWRALDNTTIPASMISSNVICLNGAFHSIVCDNCWIFTFDLREEKTGRLSTPCGLAMNSLHYRLISISNQLCLIDESYIKDFNNSLIVIWKMKEYGVAESWTKDVVLDTLFAQYGRPVLETILQNGDILFSSRSEGCMSYNPTNKKFTKLQVYFYDHRSAITHTPNLLSLEEALAGGNSINL